MPSRRRAVSARIWPRSGHAQEFELTAQATAADAVLVLAVAVALGAGLVPSPLAAAPRAALVIAGLCCLVRASSRVLRESLVALPPLGLQLQVVRGFRWPLFLPLSTSTRFIPAEHCRDLVINEALHRWNVRYYMAVLTSSGPPVHVVFENTLPPFPILLDCYRTLRPLLSRQ